MPPTSSAATRTVSRPGGRSAQIRAAVHRAVQELVTEADEPLTIPVVAARAGVHATTLYRRWGSVRELVDDVASSRFSGDIVVPDTGDLREDLERYAANLAKDLSDPDVLALLRATIRVSGDRGASACRSERRQEIDGILERERVRGGETPSVERATDAVLAPLYYRAVFTAEPLGPEWTRALVSHLLDG